MANIWLEIRKHTCLSTRTLTVPSHYTMCVKARLNVHIFPFAWLHCIYIVFVAALKRHTHSGKSMASACHVVLSSPAAGDGWRIHEAPFRAPDQGLRGIVPSD